MAEVFFDDDDDDDFWIDDPYDDAVSIAMLVGIGAKGPERSSWD